MLEIQGFVVTQGLMSNRRPYESLDSDFLLVLGGI